MSSVTLTASSKISISPDQLSSDLQGESVLLNLKSGIYYGLDGVGARMWQLIETPQTIAAICDQIAREYDVTAADCQPDIIRLASSLLAAELILLHDD